MDERTWEQNALEFAELDKGEGWPFAILVACSVQPGKVGGRRSNLDRDLKVDATTFAARAETSNDRILRYYRAWQKAALNGYVPNADTLKPSDVDNVKLPTLAWSKSDAAPGEPFAYSASAEAAATKPTTAKQVQKALDSLPPVQRDQVVNHALGQRAAESRKANAIIAEEQELRMMAEDRKILTNEDLGITGSSFPEFEAMAVYSHNMLLIRKRSKELIKILSNIAVVKDEKAVALLGDLVDAIAPHLAVKDDA